jgi:signal transduction histidine kinase
LNSLQALGKSGAIIVRAEAAVRDGKRHALLSVSDTGPGVPHFHRQRVFQPFFTTKAKGTGLGLAVVRRIVEGHGGAVSIEDRPEGEGAAFQLWLPL